MTDTTTAQMLVELTLATDGVRGKGWLSTDLGGAGATVGLLGSTSSPLAALGGAGLGWFTSYVSFLEQPLSQLRGNPGSVSSSAQDFDGAGQDVANLARSYRDSISAQTTNWSGQAAADYRAAGSQHADGIAALGQASTAMASAISGAGEVVAQAIEAVTQLVSEAVGKIIPIMSKAVAEAPATFGQSIAVAIPACVQIAVEYGQKILAKLAALLSSGQNLLKLVQGALAVVDLVKQTLSQISQRSNQNGTTQQSADSGAPQATRKPTVTPTSSTGSPSLGSSGMPYGATPSRVSAQSVDGNPLPYNSNVTGTSSHAASATGGSGPLPTRAGDHPMGMAGFGPRTGMSARASEPGTRTGIGRRAGSTDPNGQESAAGRAAAGTPGAGPGTLGAPMGGTRPSGEGDKEHQRRYSIIEQHDEESVVIAPAVITGNVITDG